MIKIIVDSTADLPKEYFKKYDIEIVPLIVNINSMEYKDKVNITLDELYSELRNGSDIKTSQPNVQDIYDTLVKHAKNNNEVIFITISSRLSGTYQTIHLVIKQIKEEYPNFNISLIDSKGGSAIAGLMALQAGLGIKNNISFLEITLNLLEMADSGEHIFTVNDLRYLFKSGRLGRATALIGNLLRIKPILHVENGEIILFKKVRGKNKSLNEIINLVDERIAAFPKQIIGIMHADDLELANEVKQKIIDKLGKIKIIINQIGSVLGSHLGIGGVGVFFFNKKPRFYFNEI